MHEHGNLVDEFDAGVDHYGAVHVYPLFGREHKTDGTPCWCDPEPDYENPNVLIHHPEQ